VKITIKLDYACRILCELAREYRSGKPVRLDRLSKIEQVPANFLAQILGELRTSRLVESKRGINGGFLLTRSPEQITLLDIAVAIEGGLLDLSGNHKGKSGKKLKEVWQEIGKFASIKAAEYTLDTIADMKEIVMYDI
jgi:Rrf2 family protein